MRKWLSDIPPRGWVMLIFHALLALLNPLFLITAVVIELGAIILSALFLGGLKELALIRELHKKGVIEEVWLGGLIYVIKENHAIGWQSRLNSNRGEVASPTDDDIRVFYPPLPLLREEYWEDCPEWKRLSDQKKQEYRNLAKEEREKRDKKSMDDSEPQKRPKFRLHPLKVTRASFKTLPNGKYATGFYAAISGRPHFALIGFYSIIGNAETAGINLSEETIDGGIKEYNARRNATFSANTSGYFGIPDPELFVIRGGLEGKETTIQSDSATIAEIASNDYDIEIITDLTGEERNALSTMLTEGFNWLASSKGVAAGRLSMQNIRPSETLTEAAVSEAAAKRRKAASKANAEAISTVIEETKSDPTYVTTAHVIAESLARIVGGLSETLGGRK